MKKLLLLIPLILINCNKKEEKMTATTNNDSLHNIHQNSNDSTNNGVISVHDADKEPAVSTTDTFRVVEGEKIIKTINGDMLPMEISDEFTTTNQQMIIKIKNFTGTKITGQVTSTNPQLNIRFNQIRLANGEFDGPFGADLNYDIKEKGEIWLIIGKNLMATGETTGKFTVSLK